MGPVRNIEERGAGPGPGLKFQISRVWVQTFENRGTGSKELNTRASRSNVKNSKF